jgi:hypothetical protein
MTKEEKAAARATAAQAEADAALKRIQQLRDDPALAEPAKRAGWIRNILAIVEPAIQSSPRLREAVRTTDVRALTAILGEVMARAELRARVGELPGFEVQSDIEVAKRVPDVHSVAEWQKAHFGSEIDAWEKGGKKGPRPGSREAAKLRVRGNEVWESMGQADNLIVERQASGKLRIDTIEETKTGNETAESAKAQAVQFREALGTINDSTWGESARVFERAGAQELGADRTGDFDLATARQAKLETRGVRGREGFETNLPVDRAALEAAAKELIKRGLPREETAGPPPATPQDRRREPVPTP